MRRTVCCWFCVSVPAGSTLSLGTASSNSPTRACSRPLPSGRRGTRSASSTRSSPSATSRSARRSWYASRAVQSHPHGGQFDFARSCTCAPWGVRVDELAKSRKNTHPKNVTAPFRDQDESVGAKAQCEAIVKQMKLNMSNVKMGRTRVLYAPRAVQFHPHGGSIRFRLTPRAYAPWGCIVRVVSQAESRKIPTRQTLPLVCVSKYQT